VPPAQSPTFRRTGRGGYVRARSAPGAGSVNRARARRPPAARPSCGRTDAVRAPMACARACMRRRHAPCACASRRRRRSRPLTRSRPWQARRRPGPRDPLPGHDRLAAPLCFAAEQSSRGSTHSHPGVRAWPSPPIAGPLRPRWPVAPCSASKLVADGAASGDHCGRPGPGRPLDYDPASPCSGWPRRSVAGAATDSNLPPVSSVSCQCID
jgi:hypothetical protein